MAYGLSNGHVTDDVTWPPNVLWGSTVGYPSDSLASCSNRNMNSAIIWYRLSYMSVAINDTRHLKNWPFLIVAVFRRCHDSGEQSSDVLERPLHSGHRRQQPTSTVSQPASTIVVGELHSAIGLSSLWARRSGTHYRLSFVSVCQFGWL